MKRLFGMREETMLLVFFVLSIFVPVILPLAWLSFLSIPLFLHEVSEEFQLLVLSLACPTTPLLLFVGVVAVFCYRHVLNFYAELWNTFRNMRKASGIRLDACRFLVRLFLRNLSRPANDRLSWNEMQYAVQRCGGDSGTLRVRRTAGDAIDYDVYEYRARDFLTAVCPDIAKSRTSRATGYGSEFDEPNRKERGGDQDAQEQAQLADFVGDVTSRLKEQERRQRRTRREKKKE